MCLGIITWGFGPLLEPRSVVHPQHNVKGIVKSSWINSKDWKLVILEHSNK